MRLKIRIAIALAGVLAVSQVSASPVEVVSTAKPKGSRGQRIPIEMINAAKVNAYLPGIGRLRFTFNEVNPLSDKVRVESGTDCDQKSFSALRGTVVSRKFSGRASAIGVQIDGEEFLRVSFIDPTKRLQKLHRVTIPIRNPKNSTARTATGSKGSGGCEFHAAPEMPNLTAPITGEQSAVQKEIIQAEASALRVASISTFADKAWTSRFGSLAGQQVGMFIQEAELIYKEQLAIRFRVENIVVNVFDSVAKAGSSDASSVLNVFSNYVRSSSYNRKSDLYHLLTGVDLSGSTIGIAYVGVLCKAPDYVHGVSSFTNNTITPVTIAHELGHNFGANHSSSGVMKPAADGESLSTLRFSRGSVDEMKAHLSSANYSCIPISTRASSPLPTPTVAPSVTPIPKVTSEPSPAGVSLELSVAAQGEGRFSYSVKTDKARSSCRVAMQYSFDEKPWGTFMETAMSGATTSGTGRFTSSNNTPVRVSALYTCGTTISKRSNSMSVIPGRL
jgi:hypothetical protein